MSGFPSRCIVLATLGTMLAGCSDSPTATDAQLILVGYLEVGAPIEARILRNGHATIVTHAGLQFSPAGAVSLDATGNGFTFLITGAVTISASDSVGTIGTKVNIEPTPKILFDMAVAGNRDIYRATILGTNLERLTSDPAVDLQPTGTTAKVVFTSYRNGNGELYSHTFTAAVGTDVRLSNTIPNETEAAISPDGQHLAYTRDEGNTPRIYVADGSNTNAELLTGAGGATIEGKSTWRFGSDSLLFMSTSQGNPSIFRNSRLPGSTPVSAARPLTSDSAYTEPSWSVDGRLVAYSAGAIGGVARIAIRNRATGIATFLTPSTISAGHPMFLADGRVVFTVFASNGSTSLAWVDPLAPLTVVAIPLTGTDPQNPAIIWP